MTIKPDDVKRHIATATAAGKPMKFRDGRSLYLYVKNGRAFWLYQWQVDGKGHCKSLGPWPELSPKQARDERDRFVVNDRQNVITFPRKTAGDLFGAALTTYLETHDKVTGSTRSLAERFITAAFKAKSVKAITAKDVAALLKDGKDERGLLWTGPGPNRGNRLRLLMLAVFAAEGVRPNPAEWNVEGAQLPHLMPDADKYQAQHHKAMPHADVPAFVKSLTDSIEDRAGLFVILTAVRRNEALAAKWSEFDFAERVWVVPAERMKKRKPHAVPLTDAMIACLGTPGAGDDYVFQNARGGPLSNSHGALTKEWFPKDPADPSEPYTLHGFRSTFADWASEQDHGRRFAPKVIDTALAHKLGDSVTRAYFRSPLFEARRELMEAWSRFATGN